ncbi:MAG: type IX secretion system outer membrane channel protein PorV [Cruoricaptor ignavus]|nr:type IX secretion system outer membrane channel protein PorV [Cruoricaptor ignavus]
MKKIWTPFFISIYFFMSYTYSQNDNRIIQTAMPFLSLVSDARASAMGGTGVATNPDIFSQNWNPAKYVFFKKKLGIGASYTPYLNRITNDIFLGSIYGFKKLNNRSAWGVGFNYFNMGKVELTETQGNSYISQGILNPNELTLDISYNLLLSDKFSMGVLARWLHSNLQEAHGNNYIANGISVGISGFYQNKISEYSNCKIGFNISNIGPKLSYRKEERDFFIPTNLKVGVGYDFTFDNLNKLSFSLEANKLLVPSPPIYNYIDKNNNGQKDEKEPMQIVKGKNPNVSFLQGIFQSFSDAPMGLSEEIQEIIWNIGIEYDFQDIFFMRGGYFYENPNKGGRNYATTGVGFRLENLTINLSYLFSNSHVPNPLENSLGVSLEYNF